MKIDTDLRAAIRAACNSSRRNANDRAHARQLEITALKNFFKTRPMVRARIDATHNRIVELESQVKALRAESEVKGVGRCFYDGDFPYSVSDHKQFAQAGGKLAEPDAHGRMSFDQIMAQLAAATPKEGAKIIAAMGIKWT